MESFIEALFLICWAEMTRWTVWKFGKAETGVPHWHYVTYGYSELYEKECEDPAVSGYGLK